MKITPVEGYYSYVKRDESKENNKKKRKKIFKKETKERSKNAERNKERDTEGHFDCYQLWTLQIYLYIFL